MSVPLEPMDNPPERSVLVELDEWAAVGFCEGLDLPYPRAYGLALRRLYENMPVRVPADRLLLPGESLHGARTMESHGMHHAVAYICNLFHHSGLELREDMAEIKKQRFPHHADAIDSLVRTLRTRLRHFGGYTHSNPDIRRVLSEGVEAMAAEVDRGVEQCRRGGDSRELNLLLALQDYSLGIRAYHRRAVAAVQAAAAAATGSRRQQLDQVGAALAHAFIKPARTFLEGLLAVNLTWMLDGCDSIGRLDQALGPLFESDLQCGRLDRAFARRLLDEFWRTFERMNGWNLQIGGRTASGKDGCNELTREIILACGRQQLRRPNVALRITADTPSETVHLALKTLGGGSGRPALYNDDLYIRTLLDLDLGLTPEDAAEIGFGGCTETMIGGLSNVGSLEGEINLAKALELALFNGVDPLSGKQVGPRTGEFARFPDFAAFEAALLTQIRNQTERLVGWANSQLAQRDGAEDPKLYRTFFTRDCVKNRRSFEAGGARYNWSVVSYQGIGNLIDGAAAVKWACFEQGTVEKADLLQALQADFAGHEQVLMRLRAAPRFGNDIAPVDELGARLLAAAWEDLLRHRQVRGGRFLPACIVFATYARAGESVGATPDGRRAGAALSDSVGAVAGRDRKGPTALLNSVARLPLWCAPGTPVLNLRFTRKTLGEQAGLDAVNSLIRSFFARGGMQVQLSVINRESMLAAQADPRHHQDLLVRIGGYSEYFVRLDKRLQDSVIERTEYSL